MNKRNIIDIIMHSRGDARYHQCAQQFCVVCVNKIIKPIEWSIANEQPIHFILPAFPAKSANPDKTLSPLPDTGERLALRNLNQLLTQISRKYAPGARLTICSDGRVFNDIVGVTDEAVTAYVTALKAMVSEMELDNIDFFDLADQWPDYDFALMRKELVEHYAQPIEEIRHLIKADQNEQLLFNGLHRFLYEDYKFLIKHLSKNQIRKLAHQHTYQLIQRSHAWSALIKSHHPNSIRLSIHPQTCGSEKLAFQLVEGNQRWATPWHNVVVIEQGKIQLMKNHEAKRLNAKLICHNDQPSHYELLGEAS